MKITSYIFGLLVLSLAYSAQSQDIAMDFTQNDCEGNPHQLFSEHDAGTVVVLEFVMLNCAPCIVGTNALESILETYENSHPGRVHVYSFGFLNSYTCEQISAWKNDNGYNHPVFNNGEVQVDYYGGMGMPTIVVTGTNTHKVFYKSIGYVPSMDKDIKAAIDSALIYNPTGISEKIGSDRFKVFPTVIDNQITVYADASLAGSQIVLFDAFGRELMKSLIPESGRTTLTASGLASGIYFIRLMNKEGISEGVKLIKN